jgi:hypothetical protein
MNDARREQLGKLVCEVRNAWAREQQASCPDALTWAELSEAERERDCRVGEQIDELMLVEAKVRERELDDGGAAVQGAWMNTPNETTHSPPDPGAQSSTAPGTHSPPDPGTASPPDPGTHSPPDPGISKEAE